MDPECLWAKSKRADEPDHSSMRLSGHLADVLEAATRVLDATADEQLRALGLAPEQYRDRLRRCVRLAAAVHDLGKANDHFQGMILGARDVRQNPQGLRHEWVSVLILRELKDWPLPGVDQSEMDFAAVEWAVAGHHPRHDHESPPTSPPKQGGSGPAITLRIDCPDFAAILKWIAANFELIGSAACTRFTDTSAKRSRRVRPLERVGQVIESAVGISLARGPPVRRRGQELPDRCRRRGLGAAEGGAGWCRALGLDHRFLFQSPGTRRHPDDRRPSTEGRYAANVPARRREFRFARKLCKGRMRHR